MSTKIFKNFAHFVSREDKSVNGVSPEFAAKYPNWEAENRTNDSCWNCHRCAHCSICTGCKYCNNCTECVDSYNCKDCYDVNFSKHMNSCSNCMRSKHCVNSKKLDKEAWRTDTVGDLGYVII